MIIESIVFCFNYMLMPMYKKTNFISSDSRNIINNDNTNILMIMGFRFNRRKRRSSVIETDDVYTSSLEYLKISQKKEKK